ncbi:MAG: hypothetical protein JWN21_2438 [Sphingomonas bacterium]|uniref:MipA/OmpV family protein n=1 Tax=Sphingomonas bacterium TaxID=1895847 RepID=UPI00260F8440|nr:MipA/OmpV family protein [Sphingomonas bacterium]MDB5696895.1 hypothetical protein [Sphingomonas bacterium]
MLRTAALLALLLAAPAVAKDTKPRLRTRVALGPQIVPSYPGADSYSVRPFLEFSRARGDDVFAFEAPDESFGFPILRDSRFQFGPSLGFEGERTARDVGVAVPKVGFTVEAGGFAQYHLAPAIRLRGELRKGIGGHKGLIGSISADFVARDRDRWLFSLGPRLTLADTRYQRAYFGISPATAAATGLPAFRTDGGVQAVGITAGALRQLNRRWGVTGYARYDRLVADAARSPLVRGFGSRGQLSGGVALSYTLGAPN